jgi:hypothetical protein
MDNNDPARVDPPSETAQLEPRFPFLTRYPVIAGVIAGILLRFAFSGGGGSRWSPMAGAFIYLAPIVVGAVTVYFAERIARRSWRYYVTAPFFATCFFVLGTLLVMVEGLICAVVIVPMFALLGSLGGLFMGAICRFTNWPRATLYSLSAMPVAIALVFGHIAAPEHIGVVERARVIHASADVVWNEIISTREIRSEEMAGALAMRIGVPPPIIGKTQIINGERIRRTRWGKDVHFDEVVTQWRAPHFVRWTYRFYPDSFPPHALDDHVLIGGHYFDLKDTWYELTTVGNDTLVTTRTTYRISTQFNFYANWAAQWLIGDLLDTGLALFAKRSETSASMAAR